MKIEDLPRMASMRTVFINKNIFYMQKARAKEHAAKEHKVLLPAKSSNLW